MPLKIPRVPAYPGRITAAWAERNLQRIRDRKVVRIPLVLRKGASQAEYDRVNIVWGWVHKYGYTRGDGLYDHWTTLQTWYPPHSGTWV